MNWLNKAKLMDMEIISTGSSWELLICIEILYGVMTFKGYVTWYNSQQQFTAQQCWNNVATIQDNVNVTTVFLH